MKGDVAKRPGSAPPARASGVESVEALTKKKHKESVKALKKMSSEYSEWLKSVSQARFELPSHTVVTREEQDRRNAEFNRRLEEDQQHQKQYYEGIRKMEQKHHNRIMRRLKEKQEADKRYNENQEAAADALAAKMEQERQRQRAISLKSQQELNEMKIRVKSKPLWLELAYKDDPRRDVYKD